MGQVIGVLEKILIGAAGIATLVGAGLLVALLFRLAWSVLGIRVPHRLRPVGRWLERGPIGALGPLPQTVLCVLVVLITALILRTPEEGPWASVMGTSHHRDLSTTMLTGAAALLVLLSFAASRAKSAEEAAQDGEKYMGHVLRTYRFLHSPWTRLTRQRAFQALVIALFALPVLLTVLPVGATVPFGIPLVDPSVLLEDLLTALWCAAFALVGGVLILHLASSLRIAQFETTLVQILIRWDLEDESRTEWRELLRDASRRDPSPRLFREWAQGHLARARALPVAEQEGYLLATVLQGVLLDLTGRQLRRARRRLEKAAHAAESTPTTLPDNTLRAVWQRISTDLRVQRRRERAAREVESFEGAHNALISTCTDALAAPAEGRRTDGDTQTLARLLSQRVINSGQRIAGAHRSLVDIGESDLADSLLTPSAALPDRSFLQGLSWHGGEATPKVLTYTATGFRDLARFAYDPLNRSSPRIGIGLSLSDLMERAREIGHPATKDYVLSELVTCFLRGVVTDDHPAEDPDALETLWKRYRPGPSDLGRETAIDSSAAELIEQLAFIELTHHGDLAPAATKRLLSLLTGWRVPCALLHALLYARRSGRKLSATQLAPYEEAIGRHTPFAPDALAELRTNALKIIRNPSYNTSHFTSDQGISWLVEALGQRLTTDLCLEFARRRDTYEILELQLLDFIQWHLLMGAGLAGPSTPGNDADLSSTEIGSSATALWTFAETWSDIRPDKARELRAWLRLTVGPEPHHETSSGYTWATRTRLADTSGW